MYIFYCLFIELYFLQESLILECVFLITYLFNCISFSAPESDEVGASLYDRAPVNHMAGL